MADGTRSPYLGPHVIGQRVVVRRILDETGPTGGPAFTDVLGLCTGWDPCVVRTASGEVVTIPLTQIVSGKPVPPRPSVRLRAGFAECEARGDAPWADEVDLSRPRVHVQEDSDVEAGYLAAGWVRVGTSGFHLAGLAQLRRTPPGELPALTGTPRVVDDWMELRPGTTPLAELLDEAGEQGVSTLWLHADQAEVPGFLLHHGCLDLVPPPA